MNCEKCGEKKILLFSSYDCGCTRKEPPELAKWVGNIEAFAENTIQGIEKLVTAMTTPPVACADGPVVTLAALREVIDGKRELKEVGFSELHFSATASGTSIKVHAVRHMMLKVANGTAVIIAEADRPYVIHNQFDSYATYELLKPMRLELVPDVVCQGTWRIHYKDQIAEKEKELTELYERAGTRSDKVPREEMHAMLRNIQADVVEMLTTQPRKTPAAARGEVAAMIGRAYNRHIRPAPWIKPYGAVKSGGAQMGIEGVPIPSADGTTKPSEEQPEQTKHLVTFDPGDGCRVVLMTGKIIDPSVMRIPRRFELAEAVPPAIGGAWVGVSESELAQFHRDLKELVTMGAGDDANPGEDSHLAVARPGVQARRIGSDRSLPGAFVVPETAPPNWKTLVVTAGAERQMVEGCGEPRLGATQIKRIREQQIQMLKSRYEGQELMDRLVLLHASW